MTVDFVLKCGDTLPALAAVLTAAEGQPVNLGGATVRFRLRRIDAGEVWIDAPATIISAVGGSVRYEWAGPDTAVPGDYWGEFAVCFADGRRQSFPNDRHLRVRVLETVG